MKIYINKKTITLILLTLLVVAGIVIYSNLEPSDSNGEKSVTITTTTRFLMDTTVVIKAVGPDSQNAVNEAFAEIERVENLFSRHKTTSDIARINQNAGQWVTVSREVFELAEKAIYYGQLSSGAFDVSIGRILDIWGFGNGLNQIPSEVEIDKAKQYVDFNQIELDTKNQRMRIPLGMVLDFGGIAKGYAVDMCRQILLNKSITSAMISAGGDIYAIGFKEENIPWRIGIQHPRKSTDILAIINLSDKAVVTSGDYERYFIKEGARFHHIIDPGTGRPTEDLISVTIIANSATDADALSTAVFVLGQTKGAELIEKLKGVEGLIVDAEGEIWVSSGLRAEIELL